MESQDSTDLFLLKVWPWIEANQTRILAGFGGAIALILLVMLYSYEQAQNEVNAGQAFTDVAVIAAGKGTDLSGPYFKVANDYAGTQTAQRALLQGASYLFTTGHYAEAEAQFKKFVDAYPASSLIASAVLGVAASLEAQGKANDALAAYKKVLDGYNDLPSQVSAKFALGRISEQQGKIAEALRYYQEVSRGMQGSALAQQAGLKVMELTPLVPAKPLPTAAVPAATTQAPNAPAVPLVPLTK